MMKACHSNVRKFFPIFLSALVLWACGPSKLVRLREEKLSAVIRLPSEEEELLPLRDSLFSSPARDTLRVVGLDGKEVLIMKAIKDEETGEMVATDQIDAAYVAARFRNVAERNGLVNLEFQVVVPESMQDSEWQLRFHLDMFILEDSLRLEDILITGTDYREAQLRGYERYEKFLGRIITDSLKFIDMRNLEIFLSRNIPELFAYKTDSSYVSENEFMSKFGVDAKVALDHYTHRYLLRRNERLIRMKEKMWNKYIKTPIVSEGIRLDTVLRGDKGEFIYNYIQTVRTRPKLRKVDICMSGEIYEQDKRIYSIPRSSPLTFYVSSVSSFADDTPKYLTKIISRNIESNTVRKIDFRQGKYELEPDMANNAAEISAIKSTLRAIVENEDFMIDSIVIAAFSSPEGNLKSNLRLSYKRAESVSEYFDRYLAYIRDSIRREEGIVINLADYTGIKRELSFKSRSGGENWFRLDELIKTDSVLSDSEKAGYFRLRSIEDLDLRENRVRELLPYTYLSKEIYPQLRTVNFNIHLHRRDMQKDTVHTTVLDSVYMVGVEALKEHDYEKAISILAPYNDFNSALACVAMDRNASAMSILEQCPRTAKVNYLFAILYSRKKDDKKAVEAYLHACSQDPSFVHRGNLDPEISSLISKYNLNKE